MRPVTEKQKQLRGGEFVAPEEAKKAMNECFKQYESESSLIKDWLRPEEDEAWRELNKARGGV